MPVLFVENLIWGDIVIASDNTDNTNHTMASFMPSPLYIVRGAIFVWSHRGLWKYAAAPILISMVILAGSYILLYDLFVKFVSSYTGHEWYGKVLYYLLLVIVTLVLLAAFFFIFTRLASALSAPFNDVISQKTEEIATGTVDGSPFSSVKLLQDAGRSLAHSFRLLGLYVGLLVIGLLLLLVPVMGGALYSAFGVLVSAYMFAYEYLGYPMDRRRFSWAQKRTFLRSRLRSALGFGLASVAVAAVPIVNFFFIPAAVAGGTLLFLDLAGNPRKGSIAVTD
jgi:CysZ protein